ncbi:MAG: hypothetical protein KDE46_27320, partial [Caldilineaceae bacterium]|nr:hypothetical protein [Caldilineaceae bacterium]
MNRNTWPIAFCIVGLFIAGCQPTRTVSLTLEELAFWYLVGIPFVLGVLIGGIISAGINQFITVCLVILTLSLEILLITRSILQLPISATPNLLLFAIVAFWANLGFYIGYQAVNYLRLVGPRGYFFTFGLRFIGVCLNAILIEGPLSQILAGRQIEVQTALDIYGTFLILSITMLALSGNYLM